MTKELIMQFKISVYETGLPDPTHDIIVEAEDQNEATHKAITKLYGGNAFLMKDNNFSNQKNDQGRVFGQIFKRVNMGVYSERL